MIFTAVVSATLAAVISSPAYAAPPIPGVPNSGSRPAATGSLTLPGTPGVTTPGGGTTQPASLTGNPVATQLDAKQIEFNQAGQRTLALQEQLTAASAAVATAEQKVVSASAVLAAAETARDSAAAETLKEEAALPPDLFTSDLYKIGSLWRVPRAADDTAGSLAADLTRAQDAAIAAVGERDAALAAEAELRTQLSTGQAALKALENELRKIREQNEDQLTAIAAQQDAAEAALGADYLDNSTTEGLVAHPKALQALQFAMAQRGKMYEWAAEGPNTYDCSGLMWAAYRSVGFQLPRVANDQYYATRGKTVSKSALLPGDMVFFSTSNRWSDVYHVGMYVGEGKMVNAPTFNEVVQVQSIQWSRFFAATRVFGAVEGPSKAGDKPKPNPKPQPAPTPPKAGSPITGSPKPTPGTSGSPTPGTSGSPTPTPSGSGSPGPSTSPSTPASPPPSPSVSPSTPLTPPGPPSPTPAASSLPPANPPSGSTSASASSSKSASAAASGSASAGASASADG